MEHKIPLKPYYPPIKQKLRRTSLDISLKIKEEVKKKLEARFLTVAKYPQWVANIVSISKKAGKVRMCIVYKDLNRANPKDDFPLSQTDILGTFCYKVMPFGLKNVGATKYCLRLNPTKRTFGVKSGKLLGFIVSEKEIEVDLDKKKEWDEDCQKAFEKIKSYLKDPPILVPPVEGRPLIMYLTMLEESMGCVLRQHDEFGKKEQLAHDPLVEYQPMKHDFPDEDIFSLTDEERPSEEWTLLFDSASNALGFGIGASLISPQGRYFPFTARLGFSCTNNMAEYEACAMGIDMALEYQVKDLKVYGDFALVVHQLRGELETRDAKLAPYHSYIKGLTERFKNITFHHTP
ncbi:hypothetical protein CR513_43123, partial [Mucuna pruriens]